VHPQESIFRLCGEILEVGVVHLVVLERLLSVTNKKSSTFLTKKMHPRQNPGYAYVVLQ